MCIPHHPEQLAENFLISSQMGLFFCVCCYSSTWKRYFIRSLATKSRRFENIWAKSLSRSQTTSFWGKDYTHVERVFLLPFCCEQESHSEVVFSKLLTSDFFLPLPDTTDTAIIQEKLIYQPWIYFLSETVILTGMAEKQVLLPALLLVCCDLRQVI